MSAEVLMPQLGETVAEGKILAWFKAVGDEVREGDNIFEVETDKVTVEVPAIASGPLAEIRVPAGEVARVGAVVAVIGSIAPVMSTNIAEGGTPPAPTQTRSPFEEVSTAPGRYGPAKGPLGLRITPLARRLIALNGLDMLAVAQAASARGSTRISQKDVHAAIVAAASPRPQSAATLAREEAPAEPAAFSGAGTVVELNVIRRRTGERLAENWRTIPHVFQAIDVDFTCVESVRVRHREQFKRDQGLALTFLPFIARATCLALREFPQVNARLQGASLALASDVNLGIAVDLSHEGLVVPVVRNADELTVTGLARAIARIVDKARAGRLGADDLSGGTYSISNNGAFGTTFTAPIINAPQVAILSVDAIRKRPAVVATAEGEFVAARPIGIVGQSFDHRAFDGAYSAAFLSRFKVLIQDRDWAAEFQ
jgi:pyruvate/2-oxoglutarate dehydrogenase complex dihydrolipoamide acyltransferase (E2) component